MPFASEAQRKHLWATDPALAAKWEAETPPGKLPDHVDPPPVKAKTFVKPVRKVRKIK